MAKPTKRSSSLAVGYVRVSTTEQAREGISLDAQEERIQQYCSFRELKLAQILREEGVSGSVPLEKRPSGAELVRTITDGYKGKEVAHVVGVKLDRLFRDVLDCLQTTNVWTDAGITLHLTDLGGQSVDSSTAMGKFFLTFIAAMAEWERNMVGERTREALAQKKRRGEPVGCAPYGMCWSDNGVLVPNQEEQAIIQRIIELKKRGLSYREIVDELMDDEVPCRGKKWHVVTLFRILRRV